jgi:hypothetical protein
MDFMIGLPRVVPRSTVDPADERSVADLQAGCSIESALRSTQSDEPPIGIGVCPTAEVACGLREWFAVNCEARFRHAR